MSSSENTQWKLTNKRAAETLSKQFEAEGIDYSLPAFCDSEAFLRAERLDARVMERYAHLIEAKEYSREYLGAARKKIEVAAEAVRAALAASGQDSQCIQAAGLLGRILDHMGIWNYQAKATLTIKFASHHKLDPIYFWVLDEGQFYAAHAILVAPPFGIVDVSLRHQPYSSDVKRNLLPAMVVADKFQLTSYAADDLANSDIRAALKMRGIPFKRFLQVERPQLIEVMAKLPARAISTDDVTLKYVVTAVGGVQETLEKLTWMFAERSPMQIYQKDVLPKL